MKIKTLAEILAESDSDSASNTNTDSKKLSKPSNRSYKDNPKQATKTLKRSTYSRQDYSLSDDSNFAVESVDAPFSTNKNPSKPKKRKKRFHPAANFSPEPSDVPAYRPPEAQSIKEVLAEVKQNIHGEPDDSAATNNAFKMRYDK